MPKISNDILQTYFTGALIEPNINYLTPAGNFDTSQLQGANRHPIYVETLMQYFPLRIHANGYFPSALIEQRRPSESEEIWTYRKQTYKAITKLPISKVLTSLSKIRRSQDWEISFPKDTVSAKILPEETLEEYCTNNIPGYGSITDWAFNILLKQNAIDANAVVAVLPIEPLTSNAYVKPVPIVFNSDHVLEYSEEKQIAILQSRKKVNYLLDDGSINFNMGNRFYYIDDIEFVIYDQNRDGFSPVFQYTHKLGKMPAFKVKGEAYTQYDNMVVNRSRLDSMVPFLDEAACEYSDLKGSKIQHLFPLFWYFKDRNCSACNGAGKIASTNGTKPCTTCGGSGSVKFSPFAHLEINTPELGSQALPNPPAGYITRDTAILALQQKSVDDNIFKSLSAINMQFLDQTPLNISGQAKSVDREELTNFVYNFAEDLIASIDKTLFWINEWRYNYIIPDKKARKAMLPIIAVPMNFDLLPANYLIDEITTARRNNVNPFMLAVLEQQLATKNFYNEPELGKTIKLFFELDPLTGLTIDEKTTLLGNKGITLEDFVISSYMPQFVRRALLDDPAFATKTYDAQMAVLVKYAKEKINENDFANQMILTAKQQVLNEMNAANGTNGQPAGQPAIGKGQPANGQQPGGMQSALGEPGGPVKPFISMSGSKIS